MCVDFLVRLGKIKINCFQTQTNIQIIHISRSYEGKITYELNELQIELQEFSMIDYKSDTIHIKKIQNISNIKT